MDPMMQKMLDQQFMLANNRMGALAEQHAASQKNITTVLDQLFVHSAGRAGAGSLNVIPSGLPERAMDANSAAGQPFNAPKPA